MGNYSIESIVAGEIASAFSLVTASKGPLQKNDGLKETVLYFSTHELQSLKVSM